VMPWPPLDAGLLPDDLRAKAHLLDHAPEAEVAPTAVFLLDAGDIEWKIARDRGWLREREVAEGF
jgi:hypothetical protein